MHEEGVGWRIDALYREALSNVQVILTTEVKYGGSLSLHSCMSSSALSFSTHEEFY